MRKSKTRLSYWNNGDFWLRGHAIAETDTCSRFRSDRSTRLNRKRPSSPPRFCYVDDRSSTSEKSHRTEDLLKAMTCGLRRRARDRPSPRRTSAGKSVRQRRDGSLHRWCGRVGGGLSDMTVLEKLEQFVTPLLATIEGALPDAGQVRHFRDDSIATVNARTRINRTQFVLE